VPGTQFLNQHGDPVPASLFTTPDGMPGLKASYGQGFRREAQPTPLTSRVEPSVNLSADNLPAEAKDKTPLGVQWTGFINPTETGDYLIGIKANGFAMVTLDEKRIVQQFGEGSKLGRVHLEKGHKLAIHVTYGFGMMGANSKPSVSLIWAKVAPGASPEAVEAARKADAVIAVVGITSELEGEEMPVSEPGFLGGDRTSIDLPEPEEELVEGVASAGKPLVVVLMNGSALAVNWEKEHANGILESWYSGEEGGTAIAETISGKNNPAGRLPVTFYTGVEQLPHFENYSMENRTYRYFNGKPLFPFGYGLSYTKFSYSDLKLPSAPINAGDTVEAEATVTNSGSVAGDEVAELYLKFPDVAGAPRIALRGFSRIHLESGASTQVKFTLKPRDISMVTDLGQPIVAGGAYTVSIGGGQPDTGAPTVSGTMKVNGTVDIPE
jgi:beta-glucosidase